MKEPRFKSLWQVVCRFSEPTDDRLRLYEEARESMIKTGRWKGAQLTTRPRPGRRPLHIGYDYLPREEK